MDDFDDEVLLRDDFDWRDWRSGWTSSSLSVASEEWHSTDSASLGGFLAGGEE